MENEIEPDVLRFLQMCSEALGRYEAEQWNMNLWCALREDDFGSPIEKLLYVALITVSRLHSIDLQRGDHEPGEMLPDGSYEKLPGFYLYPQKKTGNYRVDFLIERRKYSGVRGNKSYVDSSWIVECDGHEFHEKTKEQVSRDKRRDRELTVLGHRMLRFSGSDIFKSPLNVAAEIMRAVADDSEICFPVNYVYE